MFSSQDGKSTVPATQVRSSTSLSIVSSDLIVTGNLISGGEIQVDGQVEGDIRCATLAISGNACVQGEIITEQVTVRGRVYGTIRARKIMLTATSHVEGKLRCVTFAVEPGVHFEGNCYHCEDPLRDDTVVELPSATQNRHDARSSSGNNSSPGIHAVDAPPQPFAAMDDASGREPNFG